MVVTRVLAAVALIWFGAFVVGCAPRASITDWPAREALYRRHCAIEVDRGRLSFAAFDDCVHRLQAHRGEACTHIGGGG